MLCWWRSSFAVGIADARCTVRHWSGLEVGGRLELQLVCKWVDFESIQAATTNITSVQLNVHSAVVTQPVRQNNTTVWHFGADAARLWLPPPTEGDGRLCFCQRQYVGRYIGTFVNSFLAPIQVRLSSNLVIYTVIPLATGDEAIKFWKVKGQGRWGRYAPYWALLVTSLLMETVSQIPLGFLSPTVQNVDNKWRIFTGHKSLLSHNSDIALKNIQSTDSHSTFLHPWPWTHDGRSVAPFRPFSPLHKYQDCTSYISTNQQQHAALQN